MRSGPSQHTQNTVNRQQSERKLGPAHHKGQPGKAPDEMPPLKVLPPAPVRKRRPARDTRRRVLVVDKHPMVEEWIGALIAGEPDLMIARHGGDLAGTASLIAQGVPCLVLLEIANDADRALEIVRALKARFPDLPMLVFSSCDEIAHSAQALRAGARGFVSKTARGPELLHAIRQVLNGGVYLSSAMISHLAANVLDSTPPPREGPDQLLSQRELQIFAFISEGLRPTEIGQRISLSVKTVESYLQRIREKLELKDARSLFKSAVAWSKARG